MAAVARACGVRSIVRANAATATRVTRGRASIDGRKQRLSATTSTSLALIGTAATTRTSLTAACTACAAPGTLSIHSLDARPCSHWSEVGARVRRRGRPARAVAGERGCCAARRAARPLAGCADRREDRQWDDAEHAGFDCGKRSHGGARASPHTAPPHRHPADASRICVPRAQGQHVWVVLKGNVADGGELGSPRHSPPRIAAR